MKNWKLLEDHKILLAPSGAKISLARAAIDVVAFGSVAVVLLDYRSVAPAEACRNVVAYDESGTMRWQIGYEVKGQTPYTTLTKEDDQTAFLYNSVGFFLLVNPFDGNILQKEVAR